MSWRFYFLIGGFIAAIAMNVPLFLAHASSMPVENITPYLVKENRADLEKRGCVSVVPQGNGTQLEVPSDNWHNITPRDWVPGVYTFCPASVVLELTALQGVVLGVDQGVFRVPPESDPDNDCEGPIDFFVCLPNRLGNIFFGIVFSVIALIVVTIFGTITMVLIKFVSGAIALLVTDSNFVDFPLVQQGFPFILNIVNIGFFLALLIIAVMAVLRVEAFNWRKTLPRLLIAALLVNFSLVIAGILIDVSRLFMAIIVNALGPNSLENFGFNLLNNNAFFTKYIKMPDNPNTFPPLLLPRELPLFDPADFVATLIAAAMPVAVFVSLIFLLVTMFMRAVMLIILLMVAPLPYLTGVLPGLQGLARGWWQKFLKYVFVGPAILFIVVVTTFVPVVKITDDWIRALYGLLLTGAIWIGGSLLVLRISGQAGAAALKWTKSAGKFAYRNPLIAGAAATVLTGGLGGVAAGLGTKLVKRKVIEPLKERWEDRQKFNEEKEKKRREKAYKSRAQQWRPPEQIAADAKQVADVEALKAAGGGTLRMADYKDKALSPVLLQKGHVAKALGKDVEALLANGSQAQVKAIFKNKDYLRNLKPGEIDDLVVSMELNTPIDKDKVYDDLLRTLDDLRKE